MSYFFDKAGGVAALEHISPHKNEKVNELVEKIMKENFQDFDDLAEDQDEGMDLGLNWHDNEE